MDLPDELQNNKGIKRIAIRFGNGQPKTSLYTELQANRFGYGYVLQIGQPAAL
jgi:hypothetical protein